MQQVLNRGAVSIQAFKSPSSQQHAGPWGVPGISLRQPCLDHQFITAMLMCCARQEVNNTVCCTIRCHQHLNTISMFTVSEKKKNMFLPFSLPFPNLFFLFIFLPFLYSISHFTESAILPPTSLSFLLPFTRPKLRLAPDPNFNTPLSIYPFYAFHEMMSVKTYFTQFSWRWKRMLRPSELTPCSLVGGYHPWRRRHTVPLSCR
jgi:hypothetical protein